MARKSDFLGSNLSFEFKDSALAYEVLDWARWAPSGDNSQPWRFEIVDAFCIRVHGFDFRDSVLYDFDGHASHMAHGALLQTLEIAAASLGHRADWSLVTSIDNDRLPIYEVRLRPDPHLPANPLLASIKARTVQRKMMSWRPLTAQQKQALENSIGPDFQMQFFESFRERLKATWLIWNNAEIRLKCPEAYAVHSTIVEWRSQFSKDLIPDQALGAPLFFLPVMEWGLRSWERVQFMNRFLAATLVSRSILELWPGISCASHFLIRPRRAPENFLDWVHLGAAVERFWLTASQLGLHLQPQQTPLFFRCYVQAGRPFSKEPKFFRRSQEISLEFEKLVGASRQDPFGFFGRIGFCTPPKSRSLRKDLKDLIIKKPL
jgi:hypothetical protein